MKSALNQTLNRDVAKAAPARRSVRRPVPLFVPVTPEFRLFHAL